MEARVKKHKHYVLNICTSFATAGYSSHRDVPVIRSILHQLQVNDADSYHRLTLVLLGFAPFADFHCLCHLKMRTTPCTSGAAIILWWHKSSNTSRRVSVGRSGVGLVAFGFGLLPLQL
ncbi:hypothetical protein VNO77_11428 [Canavalia gladiata]|uniref:Uncharacterized protein n=1 Tax=Canavalia gladiata TaxID=3824 RepID=A0AAN9QVA3_CANGL